MAAILYVHAGDEHARALFAEGRAYWSAAFPLVLEKRGFGDVAVAGPAALDDPDALAAHDAVLVGALPDGEWSEARARAVAAHRNAVAEAPLPARVAALAGVRGSEPAGTGWITATALGAGLGLPAGARGAFGDLHAGSLTRDPSLHWRVLGAPISPAQATAWAARPWLSFRWSAAPEAEVLADWADDRGRSPAIVRRGGFTAVCATAFGCLAHAQTATPWPRDADARTPDTTALEDLLVALAGARPTLPAWPDGATWALTVRHDFDRPLGRAEVAAVLDRHERAGTSATWYWRARHLVSRRARMRHLQPSSVLHAAEDHPSPTGSVWARRRATGVDAVRAVARRARHEVALHTELPYIDEGEERRVVERAIGRPVLGSSAHGNPSCFGFQGAGNLLWAAAQGLLYTENIQAMQYLPYRPPVVEPDGRVAALDIVCLPRHRSLDVGTATKDTYAADIAAAVPEWRRRGGLLQVMNHPDINLDALFSLLGEMPREGRHDCTAAEAAAWWRRTRAGGGQPGGTRAARA